MSSFADITAVVVEADGGSRGNPGKAAYGAVLKDARTGDVLAEVGETIGIATNNVAEYRGLIAGLRMAAELTPQASVEVRMDSKLVVEQMSGNWQVKHPSMKPLKAEASALAPAGTTFTWVPRDQNKHADRLGNEALDGKRDPGVHVHDAAAPTEPVAKKAQKAKAEKVERGWSPPGDPPTTLILVRHGVTDHTTRKLFSGGLGGANPGLNDEGRAQVRATGDWLAPLAEQVDALISSPVRRTRESADILGEVLGQQVLVEDGVAEMEFGDWDGLTFAEIQEKFPDDLDSWLGDLEFAAGGGESFRSVESRVLTGLERILATWEGRTVVVVSHVTPIKVLVAEALGAPLDALFKMELSPASVTVISYFRGTPPKETEERRLASLRLFNARPTDAPL